MAANFSPLHQTHTRRKSSQLALPSGSLSQTSVEKQRGFPTPVVLLDLLMPRLQFENWDTNIVEINHDCKHWQLSQWCMTLRLCDVLSLPSFFTHSCFLCDSKPTVRPNGPHFGILEPSKPPCSILSNTWGFCGSGGSCLTLKVRLHLDFVCRTDSFQNSEGSWISQLSVANL